MPNKKLKCKHCGEYFPREGMIKQPIGRFCSDHHMFEFISHNKVKADEKLKKERDKEFKRETKRRKDELPARRVELMDNLQTLINQWVVHARDKGKPCCTCGTTNPNIKYDAGHWQTRGARSELRFNLYNINKQCSQECNVYNSGAKKEHEEFIRHKYGGHIADWLLSHSHPSLKDRFPDSLAVREEMKYWRAVIRDAGLKPYK